MRIFSSERAILEPVLSNPLEVLAAQDCLQSGTGLVLLEHEQDEVFWSIQEARNVVSWRFESESMTFQPSPETPRLPTLSRLFTGKVWLRLTVKTSEPLSLFPVESEKRWNDTSLSRDFANRFAFYGRPLFFQGKPLQCPVPGRLAPVDAFGPSPVGGTGYSWIPLAFDYRAAAPDSAHYFLSEPFTGTIGRKVEVNGRLHNGYGEHLRTRYVRLRGRDGLPGGVSVPFRRSWWMARELTLPGFEQSSFAMSHPAVEPPLLFGYAEGKALKCSRVLMLSTAMKGPSHLVFLKHGVVLGARAEELGVPGALCMVGLEGLTPGLSRRSVRLNDSYRSLVNEVREELREFSEATRRVVGF